MDTLNRSQLLDKIESWNQPFPIYHLIHAKMGPQWGFTPRKVEEWHSCFVINGHGEYRMNGKTVSLERGRIILLSPFTTYEASHSEKGTLHFFPFRFKWVYAKPGALIGHARNIERLTQLALSCVEAHNYEKSPTMLRISLTHFLYEILQSFNSTRRETGIKSVIDYLDNDPLNRSTLNEMASKANLNTKTFSRHFQKHTGLSFKTYQLRKRMEHAMVLLEQGKFPIQSVAKECGYDDPYLFSRQFKQTVGSTPSQYRKHGIVHL